jgi:hypothetical protein
MFRRVLPVIPVADVEAEVAFDPHPTFELLDRLIH